MGVMGSKPIHLMSPEDRNKAPKTKDYFIDTGRTKRFRQGCFCWRHHYKRKRELIEMGDCINCKSLDNRVSVYILIEMLREMKGTPPYDVYSFYCARRNWASGGPMFPQ